jgi:hypothetical protein
VRCQTIIPVNSIEKSLFGPVEEDSFVVAIKMGLNDFENIADIQFIYGKRS